MPLLGTLVLLIGLARADATVAVDTLSVDGLEVRALQCRLESGGLFASAMVVGALSKQKPALDACAPQGAAFRIGWTWAGGGTTVRTITGSAPDKTDCISAVLKTIQAPSGGACEAVLLVGQPAAAAAAAEALPPAPAP